VPSHPDFGPRFELRGELGRGGMGVVYRAFDRHLGREVALKALLRSSDSRLQRLQREGQAVAALHHPGILRVHEHAEYAGQHFLVCELVEGARALDTVLGERDLRERIALVRDAASALGVAHEVGVVHRDVKPENLLVDSQGRLFVTDFGVAKIEGEQRLTQTGAMLGTPHFMSPEQVEGRRDQQGPASDVWSLGVVLYLALTGKLPFEGETFGELGYAIAHSTPSSPSAVAPHVDRRLATICLRALRKDPSDRYPTAAALAADLDAYLASAPRAATSARWLVGLGLLVAGLGGVALCYAEASPGDSLQRRDPPPRPPPEACPDPANMGGGSYEAWRQLRDPLPRYVQGQLLLREYPEHPAAAEVTEALERLRSSPTALAELESPSERGSADTWAWFEGETLVGVDRAGGVTRWDLASGRGGERVELPYGLQFACPAGPGTLFLNPAGAAVATLVLWSDTEPRDVDRRRVISASLTVSPGWLAAGAVDGKVLRFRRASLAAEPPLAGLSEPPAVIAIDPAEEIIVACGQRLAADMREADASTLVIWDLRSGERLVSISLRYRARVLAFAPTGDALYVGGSTGVVEVRDPRSAELRFALTRAPGASLFRPRAHEGSLRGILEIPGRRLVTLSRSPGGGSEGGSHQLRVWDLTRQTLIRELPDPQGSPTQLDVHPELGLVAVGTTAGNIELFALGE